MGSETSSGSLYIVKLSELLNLNSSISSIKQRIHEVTTFNCTIWTIDYNFNGNQEWLATLSLSLSQHAIINTLFYFLIWCSNWFNLLSNTSFSCHVVQIENFFFWLFTGTNLGAALVDLETGQKSWVCHSKSHVFAQQFIHLVIYASFETYQIIIKFMHHLRFIGYAFEFFGHIIHVYTLMN